MCGLPSICLAADPLDLTHATLVTRADAPLVEHTAATVLIEEVEKRTGVKWASQPRWPAQGWSIALLSGRELQFNGVSVPIPVRTAKPESYVLVTDTYNAQKPVLWIVGADPRGALFGAGRVLRNLACSPGKVELLGALNLKSAPDYPIRGHQLGYRATANSWDAWTPDQFDQYIRELAIFGTNSIEGIPFHDTRPTVGSYPRSKMNIDLSRICEKYGQDYWIWVPADFDLKDTTKRSDFLKRHKELFRDCPTLSGVFVPGGDPGDNPAALVMPYLRDLAALLTKHHPKAKVWVSMQGYNAFEQEHVYEYIEREKPTWLGGLVAGPGSPPLGNLRARLPQNYAIRDYPDITHSVRCQFPVPYWDPAFAFTLGRECVNPRPMFFSRILHDTGSFTNGFITYSDGVHDDVNKVLWSSLGWDRSADLNTVMTEYARVFFGQQVADSAAAGIFNFERNWEGPLATNGGVDANLALWQSLEKQSPQLNSNWRWQMCLLRAYYDAYTRHRLIYETAIENEANQKLLPTGSGSGKSIEEALAVLKRADTQPIRPDLSKRIVDLCEDLNKSIGLQTSVAKYKASGLERGAVLDFLNYPLNNRWWMEDEIAKIKAISAEAERLSRLEALAKWENPGPGSFYDDIGNVAKSPHEVRNEKLAAPLLDVDNMGGVSFMFWVGADPLARVRQSWISDEGWPAALKYPSVDPSAEYIIRTTGVGDCLLRVNGVRIAPTLDGKKIGEIKEFPIPKHLYRDASITVTFDPTFEPQLNWRLQSRLTEIWLIKK
jgi:hypothetical protein